ncbi:hypothetical protein A3A39_00090 [Candidatus Kaiserbacteria bacterium RIFCSPLOWO2_01_FULL_54_13]|uniref:Uncharacterized protein n=1 Tax=Candidatus Kaiserbacteria bacterium RIFCSPLOWO2_01_FULL_54_13 TaxID=1798512 RepID=A0A1F6F4E3_9BACT|nr:MAG: hypothetical protein A3A39_00090 [Candidatus Kaiserbacteria bacterium RIFCSPLOWO2_01_FULL_54_13]
MDHKTYMKVSTSIFGLVALLHLARALLGWDAAIGGWEVPMWLSWVAVLGAGFLAYSGYKFQK